ncbi:cell division protein FtsA [Lacihabitans sp. LS3-19]|uniref:cell division protein FtsA n=1 Tax=Lacihabitans sp. LS3-19 TaxID=2487335 RepID=UPI0020CDE817|nr:cell division protein FtsA [Lacihabitans sp. LS3-19]MCP9769193.1 cell division protein FtsA [Lacihabitans sp. LS3-19]
MEEDNLVVGLDIGTSKISAVAGSLQKDGTIKLNGFVEKLVVPEDEVLRNGEIENAQRTIEIVDAVLEELADKLTINLESVNVNISNPDIQGHFHKGKVTKSGDNKQIQQSDVDRLAEDVRLTFKVHPGRTVLHCMPQDFYVNDVKAGEKVVGKFGVQIGGDFFFLTSKSESLENLYYTLKSVKAKTDDPKQPFIQIENVLISSIADSFSLLDSTIDDKRNGVAIINIGAEMTEICIFQKNGIRYFKAIPIGGNVITKDLADTFHISFDEADMLKKICGNIPSSSISDTETAVIERKKDLASVEIILKNASTVVEWRLKEIAAIVKSELIRSGYEGILTNGLILSGGTSSMGIIKDIFVEVCKMKSVRKAKINNRINFNGFEYLNKPKYSTLLGLLMASNLEFDNRIDNRILKHTPLKAAEPEKVEKKPNGKSEIKSPKRPLFERLKDLIIDDKMNDDYNR